MKEFRSGLLFSIKMGFRNDGKLENHIVENRADINTAGHNL